MQRLVTPEILQAKAEEIWRESDGIWGTPPGVPLESYDEMCKRRGKDDVSMATRHRMRREAKARILK